MTKTQNSDAHHLIIGGCGFIGRHVAIKLARLGHRVILACRSKPQIIFPADISDQITWKQCDIISVDWDLLIDGAEVIHYYAWTTIPPTAHINPVADISSNVLSILNLLEALKRRTNPPSLIFASSGGTVYGKVQHFPVQESHPIKPITAYGASKAAVELYLGCYRTAHGLDCRVARLANPFGAGQDFSRGQGAVTTFIHRTLTAQPIIIWGDGEIVRDYIHIADAAAGLVALSLAPLLTDGPWIFNIASGNGISLNEIVKELEIQFGHTLDVQRMAGRLFDVPVSTLDISLSNIVLNWSPRLSFAEGVAKTLNDLDSKSDFTTFENHKIEELIIPQCNLTISPDLSLYLEQPSTLLTYGTTSDNQ